MSIKNIIPFILLTGILFSSCKKEEDVIPPKVIPQANGVNLFVWSNLSDYYLWNKEVPDLSATKYAKKDSLNAFLNRYSDPQDLFEDLLYQPGKVDRWSFLVENAQDIDDWISGISETMGFDFRLTYISQGSNKLYGYVRYVYKGSPAEKAGMKRGDIFVKVNDTQISVGNYENLLFSNLTYKMSFATFVDGVLTPNDRSVTMTAVNMQENPLYLDTVFTFNNQKVGYLVYNGFNADFDFQLNDVIKNFKDANIDQLVLDLRYNGGGSVWSSIYLASMIYGTDESKVFAKAKYNEGLEEAMIYYNGEESLNDYFSDSVRATDDHPGALINTLNLNKIYFIVSDNTASASELLINGLRAYMDVTVVGDSTEGKYTGSFTLKDEDENGKKLSDYAMQPIVVKFANSQGVSDFVDGLFPDIYAQENHQQLMPLGDPNETLLKAVLNDMQGIAVTSMALKSAEREIGKVADSRDYKPFSNEMYIDPNKFKNLKKKAE